MTCEEIRKIRNKDNVFASFLGIVTTDIKPGYARGEMPVTAIHRNIIDSVHGGVLFTMADTLGGAAAASHGEYVTTISGNFNYLAPALDTPKLVGIAREVKAGKNVSVCDVKIYDARENLLAIGTFTFSNMHRRYTVSIEKPPKDSESEL